METDNPIITDGPPDREDFETQVTGIAALAEPLRRDLYRFVVGQATPVSRDRAAAGVGVARHTAKFHLDKLVDDGLLVVEFGRPPGRGGPGAGRPAKLYRRSSRELAVSLPERHYELAGRLLAQAVTDAERDGVAVGDALSHAARAAGQTLGERALREAGKRPSRSALLAAAIDVLVECGYEPRNDDTSMTLVNCPFHALAQEYTTLVCGMNLELMNGLADGLELANLEPRLDPAPGRCCVRLETSTGVAPRERTQEMRP
ncbi:MAG: helix-turn-helix domain-containing protein [Acidimicrobiia bacterium]|nr:helix-turn-helix domain-containing protein [Acidimicrobiia bacterium]